MAWPGPLLLVIAAAVLLAGYCLAGYCLARMWLDVRRWARRLAAGWRRVLVSQPPRDAGCEAAGRAEIEREWRAAFSMPAAHPESLTGELDDADEAWLDAAARELWPCREYDTYEPGGDR